MLACICKKLQKTAALVWPSISSQIRPSARKKIWIRNWNRGSVVKKIAHSSWSAAKEVVIGREEVDCEVFVRFQMEGMRDVVNKAGRKRTLCGELLSWWWDVKFFRKTFYSVRGMVRFFRKEKKRGDLFEMSSKNQKARPKQRKRTPKPQYKNCSIEKTLRTVIYHLVNVI